MSERTSERCKLTSERASEWPSTQICIFGYSGPQWIMKKKTELKKRKSQKKSKMEERKKIKMDTEGRSKREKKSESIGVSGRMVGQGR